MAAPALDRAASAEPGPVTVTSQLRSVRKCLIAILVIAIPIVVPQYFVKTYNKAQPELIPLALAAIAPWAIALGMLVSRRRAHAGFAVAASASLVALVPLVPLMAVWTLLSGFMLGNRDQWLQYFGMIVVTGLLIATSIQAIRGASRVPESEKSVWGWPAGFVGSIAYAFLLVTTVQFVDRQQTARLRAPGDNDLQARQNIETLARCAAEFAARSPGNSFPRSLRELSSGARPCLDAGVASGEVDGFRYGYYPSLPDADGIVRVYDACAEPIRYRETGFTTYVIDESGKMPMPMSPGVDSKVGMTCRGVWQDDAYKALRVCAARYAAQHPDRGYPATMRDIGPAGDGCLMTPWSSIASSLRGTNSWNFGMVRYMYIAGVPDDAGRITTYEVHAYHTKWSDSWNELADQLGRVRVAVSRKRLATARDPLRGSGTPQRIHIDDKTAVVRCAEGIVDACAVEAAHLEAGGDVNAARTMYEQACANNSGAACLWMARGLGDAPERAAQVQDLLVKACDFGDPEACMRLADRLTTTNPTMASRLRLRGCAAVDQSKVCMQLW